jgi:hypothetical protein
MTAVPFAMQKSPNWGFWATCLMFGIGLALLNYAMAVGTIGKVRDASTSANIASIERHNRLSSNLEAAKRDLQALGNPSPTSDDMVSSAREAVELAKQARDQECSKVGDYCRARQAQLSNRQSELTNVLASYSLTRKQGDLNTTIRRLEQELSELASTNSQVHDPQAARLGAVVAIFIPLGPNGVEAVATGLIHFLAISAELFALMMPRILVTAIAGRGTAGNPTIPIPLKIAGPSPASVLARKNRSIPAASAALAARPRDPGAFGAISDWKAQKLKKSPGTKLKTWDAYTSYKKWCKEVSLPEASFTSFDFDLCAEGVEKETGARSFYLNVSLT